MKVGIVGSGLVGSTAAYAMVMKGIGREIVMIDKNHARAVSEAEDIFHAIPFANPLTVHAGDYEDLVGCRAIIVTAGVNQKPGESRRDLLHRNADVFRDVIPKVIATAPEAMIIVATNPVDVMTHVASELAVDSGQRPGRVIGSGTTLDTARFRTLLGTHFGVDSKHVHAYVIGEHGDSEVLVWSLATIGGVPYGEFSQLSSRTLDESVKRQIDEKVRRAAYHIIEGKGATYYGIGSALAKIVDVILHDQRSIMTICSHVRATDGMEKVTMAMPHLFGGDGVIGAVPLSLSDEETDALRRSAAIIAEAIETLRR